MNSLPASARPSFGAVFADFHGDGRKIKNLALFLTGDRFVAQVRAALGAAVQRDGMGDVGGRALMKGLAGVARLAAGFAVGVVGAPGFGFTLQAVAGGRLAAVGTVHVEALFKLRDTGLKLPAMTDHVAELETKVAAHLAQMGFY